MARPTKPTALKLVTGTDRKDRRNGNEPEPDALIDLTPPAHLEPRSAEVWREVAPMLRRIKVLTVADVISLEMLCDSVADYRHARSHRGDDFVGKGSKGGEMISQWLVAQQMCAKRAEAFMSKFGMDPSSRSRLMINPQGDLFGQPGQPGQPDSKSRFFSA